MLTRFLALPVAFAAAVAILAAPWRTAPASAQTDGMDHGGQMEQSDPLMAQLDQLAGDEFDKAFLVQMSLHHAMAIQMARPAAANAPHQEVRDLSNAIINDQAAEMQKMSGWLQTWYGIDLPMMISMMAGGNTVPMPMDGHHPVGDLMNMGMSILWELPGPRLETVFLSEMIPHHRGAVEMAKLVPDRAAHQELKNLADQITINQSAEISRMDTWLAAWYGL